jgi:tudor domain-containing protein 1/4/6/7
LLIDFGYKMKVPCSGLGRLPEQLFGVKCFSLLCHLPDIQPAGDITKWSQTAIEAMKDKVQNKSVNIECKLQKGVSGSLPVDLRIEEVIPGTALTPHKHTFISIMAWLKDQGLALPKLK